MHVHGRTSVYVHIDLLYVPHVYIHTHANVLILTSVSLSPPPHVIVFSDAMYIIVWMLCCACINIHTYATMSFYCDCDNLILVCINIS